MKIETYLNELIQASFDACDTGDSDGSFTKEVQEYRARILRMDAEKDIELDAVTIHIGRLQKEILKKDEEILEKEMIIAAQKTFLLIQEWSEEND